MNRYTPPPYFSAKAIPPYSISQGLAEAPAIDHVRSCDEAPSADPGALGSPGKIAGMVGDGDRQADVVVRVAARVILIDSEGRTLLFRGGDGTRPEAGTWWFTPGGGVEPGEDLVKAARREVREETGLVLGDLGAPIWVRRACFEFEGLTYDQTEHYFASQVAPCEVNTSGWTDLERRSVVEHRWWSRQELRATDETVYPEVLADLLPSPLHRLP